MINKRKIIKKYKFDTTITYMAYKRVVNVLLKQGFINRFTDLSNQYPDYLDQEAGEILEEIRKGDVSMMDGGSWYNEAYEQGYQQGARLVMRRALQHSTPERVSQVFQVPLDEVLRARDEDATEDEEMWKGIIG